MRLARLVVLAAIAVATMGIAGCAGCEDSVCCAVPGHAIDRITRPSQCTSMGGTAVSLSRCEVICCRGADGTVGPAARSECSMVVDSAMCDGADAGP